MARRLGAAFAVHPAGVTIEVVLFLPDRHTVLDLVDDVPAGGKSFVAVLGGRSDPHGYLADFQQAKAVNAGGSGDPKTPHRLVDDARSFLQCQVLETLIFEPHYFAAVVAVSYPTLESYVPAR
jgi:hypothetical protein